jgi:hypothetical protein
MGVEIAREFLLLGASGEQRDEGERDERSPELAAGVPAAKHPKAITNAHHRQTMSTSIEKRAFRSRAHLLDVL